MENVGGRPETKTLELSMIIFPGAQLPHQCHEREKLNGSWKEIGTSSNFFSFLFFCPYNAESGEERSGRGPSAYNVVVATRKSSAAVWPPDDRATYSLLWILKTCCYLISYTPPYDIRNHGH